MQTALREEDYELELASAPALYLVQSSPALPAPLAAPAVVVAKRAFDVCVALLALIVLAPLFALVALAIKLDSPGPVFYRQRRIGRDGREFAMFKFRTMVDRAHDLRAELAHLNEAAEGLFKIAADPRRTRVGCLLRRVCLDEVPQLLDVVAGRMSLVGPRPLVPEEDALVPAHLRRRLDVRPGITGAWQATGDHSVSIAEMAVLDVEYVERWTPLADLRILAATAAHVLTLRGK